MNEQELGIFIEEASAAFASVDRIFRDGGQKAEHALDWWQDALGGVSLDLARGALSEMVCGDLATPDYEWGRFPGIIRKRARELQQTAAMIQRAHVSTDDDQPRYVCLPCRDSGMTEVYNRAFLRDCGEQIRELDGADGEGLLAIHRGWRSELRKAERKQWSGFHGSSICCCDAGQKWLATAKLRAEGKWRKDREPDAAIARLLRTVEHYNAYKCCRFESGKPEEIHDWWESRVMDSAQDWNPDDAWT